MLFSSSPQFAEDYSGFAPVHQPNHTWKTLFGKNVEHPVFNPQPRNSLLISQFVVMSFFIEDSVIRFLSGVFPLELYYSLHSFVFLGACFIFFVCTFTHCLSLFFFSIMFYALLEKQTNK